MELNKFSIPTQEGLPRGAGRNGQSRFTRTGQGGCFRRRTPINFRPAKIMAKVPIAIVTGSGTTSTLME